MPVEALGGLCLPRCNPLAFGRLPPQMQRQYMQRQQQAVADAKAAHGGLEGSEDEEEADAVDAAIFEDLGLARAAQHRSAISHQA